MEEEWDTDNFKIKEPVAVSANKWEGEDEDEDVKDSWDAEEDEEEEKKDVEKPEPKKQKPKKTLQEKIAEKEKARLEEMERKLKEKEEELTPEEKLRREKDSDLELALETTFGTTFTMDSIPGSVDGMNPTTKEEFAEFADLLNKKLSPLAKSPEFPAFVEDHIRNICVTLSSLDLKKLKTTIDNMYIEKQKVEKGEKTKKNKGKGKAKLRMEGDNVLNEYSAYGDYDEYDDFM